VSLQGLGQHGLRTLAAEFPLRGREPVDFFAAVRHEECPWLLETANLAGPSFIGSRPRWTLRTQHGRVALRSEGQEERSLDLRPMEALKALWSSVSAPPRLEGLPFTGGLVGYLGYDMAHCFERLPCTTVDDLGLPDAVFFVPSYVLCVEPAAQGAVLSANLVGVRLCPELLLPEVLLAYLTSPGGQAVLESHTTGSTRIRALPVQVLAAIEVPVPAARVQQRVAALVREEFAHYRAAIAAAESRRSAVTHVIACALAQG